MSFAQLSRMPLGRRVVLFIARCHDLFATLGKPYRPELHYMRGPGPKWHAKHQAVAVGRIGQRVARMHVR